MLTHHQPGEMEGKDKSCIRRRREEQSELLHLCLDDRQCSERATTIVIIHLCCSFKQT